MKIKRINPVRVFKKGKTRGRPSKAEIKVSAILSHIFKKNEKEIQKSIDDLFVYGVSITKVTP